jgi:hypothetical protein
MVSYDDTIEEDSPLDFDDFNFDKPDDESSIAPMCKEEETLEGSYMEVETPVVPEMKMDVEDQGVAPSQV